MKKLFFSSAFILLVFALFSCTKDGLNFENIDTPRSSVPEELVGRWAIVGISGSTVYNIPAGSTFNTNEYFLGYQINKDGTVQEDGYLATYQYGVSTWVKWTGFGSIQLEEGGVAFHRARGHYTSSRNSSRKEFGADEVYPNKTSTYASYEIGTNSRGERTLFLANEDGSVTSLVKQ